MASRESTKIPDRWFDYTNEGDVIKETRFITFKTPLKESYFDRRTPKDKRFTPTTLLECMGKRGLKLGLVIDLTNPKKPFYDKKEFTTIKGLQYKKIRVEGHVQPDKIEADVKSVCEFIDKFLRETPETDILIGVHCTHGVNRTGYVMCRYMMERLVGWNVTDALEAYGIARGHCVDNKEYIDALVEKSGWFDYTNVGDVIPGTKFITFKTPWKESYFDHHKTPEDKRFTPTRLLECMGERRLGLVIDLTNLENTFYDIEEFTTKGVKYEKIRAKGRVPPNEEVVKKFYETIDKFLRETPETDSLIGVHCTHGVNRTGYVICRYMMERLHMNPTDALEAYGLARGHYVNRENFIDDLMKRAGETPRTVEVENQESSGSAEGESFLGQGYDAWNDLRRPPPPL